MVLRMEHTTSRSIAEVVGRRLEAADISLRDAAHRAGIPLTTLHRRVGGTSPFTTAELAALAELLNTTVSAIVAEAEGAVA